VKRNPVNIRHCPTLSATAELERPGMRSPTSVTPHMPAAENVTGTVDDEPGDS
jgi:hypothetical protein